MKKNYKKRLDRKKDYAEMVLLLLIGAFVIFLLTLPLRNIIAMLRLFLAYLFLIYLPFVPLGMRINSSLVERFLLINLAGLSYGAVFVVFDVVFKIPLTLATYALTALAIGGLLWALLLKGAKI